MIGAPHIVTDSDVSRGLEALALRLLGDASLWPELVTLNNLIPPYLTFDPIQAYGIPVATALVTTAISAGASSFPLSASVQQWQPGYTWVLAASTAAGLISESGSIKAYDGTTLTPVDPVQNAYPDGATALVYAPAPIGQPQVLMPGGVLYLPLQTGMASFVFSAGGQQTDVFGSDAQSPISFSEGDIATAAGPAVLAQRLRTAILTPQGSLPQSVGFGSRIHQVLGSPPASVRWATWVRQALMGLPEVAQVTDVSAVQAGDTLTVSAKVYVHTSAAPLLLQNESLTLPVTG